MAKNARYDGRRKKESPRIIVTEPKLLDPIELARQELMRQEALKEANKKTKKKT